MSLKERNYFSKSTTSGSQKATRHTGRVQISNTTKVFFVPGLWEISQEEIKATWLTEEDNANIQYDSLKTLKRMRAGKDINKEKYSTRGLEHMRTSAAIEQRRTNKASVRDAVLAEQRKQKLSECHDPIEISKRSMMLSKVSRDAALTMGRLDAIAAGNKVEKKQQSVSCYSTEHVESNSVQTNPLNAPRRPCLRGDKLSKADSFVNRIYSRVSSGLEGEANLTKMKMNSRSLSQQGICIEPKTLVSKIA